MTLPVIQLNDSRNMQKFYMISMAGPRWCRFLLISMTSLSFAKSLKRKHRPFGLRKCVYFICLAKYVGWKHFQIQTLILQQRNQVLSVYAARFAPSSRTKRQLLERCFLIRVQLYRFSCNEFSCSRYSHLLNTANMLQDSKSS
jgi:hypothetical protein